MLKQNGLTKYITDPVVRNGVKYIIEFDTQKPCVVNVYQYTEQKRLLFGNKGKQIGSYKIDTIVDTKDGVSIDVSGLTFYGFQKYLNEIIDTVFDKNHI